ILILAGLGWYYLLPQRLPADALGRVLENSENAETIHLRVSFRDGPRRVDFWHTNRPQRSRWEEAEGKYRIADGPRYWVVDENANEARRAEPPAHVSRPVAGFLDALGIPEGRQALLAALPAERVREGNRVILRYQVEVPAPEGVIRVE